MNELQEKEIAVKYFLGDLSGAELETVEERFFTDGDYSDFLDEVETDLIDEYVRGELSDAEKQKFERNYLVSEPRQNRVKAADALWEREKLEPISEVKTIVATSPVSFWQRIGELFQVPSLAFGLSAIIILILVGGIWFGLRKKEDQIAQITPTPTITRTPPIPTPTTTPSNTNEGNQNENKEPKERQKQIEPNKQNPEREKTPLPDIEIEAPKPVIATIILLGGGGIRGNDEVQKEVLPAKTKTVFLKITDTENVKYNKFRLELENENGTKVMLPELKTKKNVKTLNIAIPAQKLQKGLNKLTITGAKDEGEFELINIYKFSVEKK